MSDDDITRYCRERDQILRELDPVKMVAFMRKWQAPLPERWAHPSVPLAMMHKVRLQVRTFTKEEKLLSARWLLANDYKLPVPLELNGDELIGAEYQQ